MNFLTYYGIAAACIIAPYLAGGIGALFTTPNIRTWYDTLTKPSWNPPNWVFAPVWNILYLLMGIAALLVFLGGRPGYAFALYVFFGHLIINALWSVVFFGMHRPRSGMVIIVLLWLCVVALIALFIPLSALAAWLLLPYLLWVSYAATLNLGIVLLN